MEKDIEFIYYPPRPVGEPEKEKYSFTCYGEETLVEVTSTYYDGVKNTKTKAHKSVYVPSKKVLDVVDRCLPPIFVNVNSMKAYYKFYFARFNELVLENKHSKVKNPILEDAIEKLVSLVNKQEEKSFDKLVINIHDFEGHSETYSIENAIVGYVFKKEDNTKFHAGDYDVTKILLAHSHIFAIHERIEKPLEFLKNGEDYCCDGSLLNQPFWSLDIYKNNECILHKTGSRYTYDFMKGVLDPILEVVREAI